MEQQRDREFTVECSKEVTEVQSGVEQGRDRDFIMGWSKEEIGSSESDGARKGQGVQRGM
jgi:hypothetical protein